MESTKRTYIKTITWEIFHFTVLAGIIYLFTGDWESSGLGAFFYIGVESLGYFLHERIWSKFGHRIK
jgi:uncharacterized membrane protein